MKMLVWRGRISFRPWIYAAAVVRNTSSEAKSDGGGLINLEDAVGR